MATTSWQVKRKYNAKTYERIACDVQKELGIAFKEKCKVNNESIASVLSKAMRAYLDEQ